jgi:tetratricopeptide (TPR) repeat protein
MMKKIFIILCMLFVSLYSNAQAPDAKQLHETAKGFMKQGDFPNAILVLNRALQLDPQNIDIAKDLALNYYFQKDNNKALEIIKPVLERDDVDDQCFQIAGNIYKELDMQAACEKIYKKGIKKFPGSGALYNELGELLLAQKNYEAIRQWEKGIEQDPSYSKNYYNAAKFYFLTTDKVWSILYGEIFINMEPSGSKTPEIKELLLESYKKLFTEADLEQNNKDKNNFVRSFLQSMNKQTSLASLGLNPESLTMIRTRFILEWSNSNSTKFPYHLFDYQRQLLQEGMFDAYNQWIFGSAQNLAAFQNWITIHSTEYSAFSNFQKGRIFKMPGEQYYH